jgi:hypothetical protein
LSWLRDKLRKRPLKQGANLQKPKERASFATWGKVFFFVFMGLNSLLAQAVALRFAARSRSAPPQAAGLRADARTASHR